MSAEFNSANAPILQIDEVRLDGNIMVDWTGTIERAWLESWNGNQCEVKLTSNYLCSGANISLDQTAMDWIRDMHVRKPQCNLHHDCKDDDELARHCFQHRVYGHHA